MPGHWEGDLITGELNRSAVGTLVDRCSRYVMLLHLPNDHGAEAVRDQMIDAIARMPARIRKTVTWDQGSEMARHLEITATTGVQVYFCNPHSPWERPTNENTNGLLREFLPKGANLSRYTRTDLDDIEDLMNNRPRKAPKLAHTNRVPHQGPRRRHCCTHRMNPPRDGSQRLPNGARIRPTTGWRPLLNADLADLGGRHGGADDAPFTCERGERDVIAGETHQNELALSGVGVGPCDRDGIQGSVR